MKLELGRLLATPGALASVTELFLLQCVMRHVRGDWGDLCTADCAENDRALIHGDRVLSAYLFPGGKLYIITEWDRSVSTVMLSTEY